MISNTHIGWISLGRTVHVETLDGEQRFYAIEDRGYYRLLSIYGNTVVITGENVIEIYEIPEIQGPCIRPLRHVQQLTRQSKILCMDLREFLVVVSKEDVCIYDRFGKFIKLFNQVSLLNVRSIKWQTDQDFVTIDKCTVQLWNMYIGLSLVFDRKLPVKFPVLFDVTPDLQILCATPGIVILWTPEKCRVRILTGCDSAARVGRFILAAGRQCISIFNDRLELLGKEVYREKSEYGFQPIMCQNEYIVDVQASPKIFRTYWVSFYIILSGFLHMKHRTSLSDPRVFRKIWEFIC